MEPTLTWLLEPENPSARALALMYLLDYPASQPDVAAARTAIPGWGVMRDILEAQWPPGYWIKPDVGYSPKYKATVWQVIFAAALGAPLTKELQLACAHVLDHSRLPDGRFSAKKTSQGAVACLSGNLLRALIRLRVSDSRLDESTEALAKAVVRDEFRCRYNAIGAGPGRWPSQMADGVPCAWGAVKALGAFAEILPGQRSAAVQTATEAGTNFLLAYDLVRSDFPTSTEPSPLWKQFGFPLGYTSDLVEALDVLGRLGLERSAKIVAALDLVQAKADSLGRWALEYTPENTWGSFGERGLANKWVTLRALSALKLWLPEYSAETLQSCLDRGPAT
jgi:hypothetical protein